MSKDEGLRRRPVPSLQNTNTPVPLTSTALETIRKNSAVSTPHYVSSALALQQPQQQGKINCIELNKHL